MLIYIPYLRNKLLMPFRELLHSDAGVDSFDEEAYFKDSFVKTRQQVKSNCLKRQLQR
jgi:hypothetical protein